MKTFDGEQKGTLEIMKFAGDKKEISNNKSTSSMVP